MNCNSSADDGDGDSKYSSLVYRRPSACCCAKGLECDQLKKQYAALTDAAGTPLDPCRRGANPFRVGWDRASATEEWKHALAASLKVPKKSLDERALRTRQGFLHINRLHYDPRQIALFDRNTKARNIMLPLEDMMTNYTGVKDLAACKFIDNVTHVHHFPNYPREKAEGDLENLSSQALKADASLLLQLGCK